MKYKYLPKSFFLQNTHDVAKGLLGKLLVRRWRNKDIIARIIEVECYIGENDKACHAAKGLTKRTAVMFGDAGYGYVYLIYGMYHCLNVVTERAGFPAAVLIRGAIPVTGFTDCLGKDEIDNTTLTKSLLRGPGKLTREMKISRNLNREYLIQSKRLFFAKDGFIVKKDNIINAPRIGVDYAGKDAKLPWRYYLVTTKK